MNNIYQEETKDGGTGGYCGTSLQRQNAEAAYQRKTEQILTEENCFRVSVVSYLFKINFFILNEQIKLVVKKSTKNLQMNIIICYTDVIII